MLVLGPSPLRHRFLPRPSLRSSCPMPNELPVPFAICDRARLSLAAAEDLSRWRLAAVHPWVFGGSSIPGAQACESRDASRPGPQGAFPHVEALKIPRVVAICPKRLEYLHTEPDHSCRKSYGPGSIIPHPSAGRRTKLQQLISTPMVRSYSFTPNFHSPTHFLQFTLLPGKTYQK